jgi:hypothetical protein
MIKLRSESLLRWYVSKNIIFLNIIHRPVFLSKTPSCFGDWILSSFYLKKERESCLYFKHNVSETGFCLRFAWRRHNPVYISKHNVSENGCCLHFTWRRRRNLVYISKERFGDDCVSVLPEDGVRILFPFQKATFRRLDSASVLTEGRDRIQFPKRCIL